ncbi:MAG TPA: RluA family pseudouridine synthase [Chitinophagaceae bacterium]|jgi:pseudouridine synthase, RluA family
MIKLENHLLFENDDFIAINKPAGLLSIPDREGKEISLKKMLQQKYESIYTVHRLDKGTSGVIVFAKNEQAHKFLSKQFEERKTKKIYTGLVIGSPMQKNGSIDEPISEHPGKRGLMTVYHKGKESLTDFEVLQDFGIYSWMQFEIHTGRTHQIRVHMKHLGHPVVCDDLYGDGKPVFISSIKKKNYNLSKKEEEEKPILNRLALHSSQLSFEGPDGKRYEFEAPLPKDLKVTLVQLSKHRQHK